MINTMDRSSEDIWEEQNFKFNNMYLKFDKSQVIRSGYSMRNEMHGCYLTLNNITSYPYSAVA